MGSADGVVRWVISVLAREVFSRDSRENRVQRPEEGSSRPTVAPGGSTHKHTPKRQARYTVLMPTYTSLYGEWLAPPLPPDEQNILLSQVRAARSAREQIKNGGISDARRRTLMSFIAIGVDARETLVRHNLLLVFKEVYRYVKPGDPLFEDGVQLGLIGLSLAIDRFEPEQGNTLSTLAVLYLKGEIGHGLGDARARVHMSASTRLRYTQLRQLYSRLEREAGESPRLEDVFQASGFERAEFDSLAPFLAAWLHFEGGFEQHLYEESEYSGSQAQVDAASFHQEIMNVVRLLPQRQVKVMLLRKGLGPQGVVHTIAETARKLSITVDTVRTEEKRGLLGLKKLLIERGLHLLID